MSFRKWNVVAVAFSLIATSIFTLGAQAAPETKSVYIVKFQDNVTLGNEISNVKKNGVTVKGVLEFAFKGFIGEMTSSQALALSKNPRVEIVEEDSEVFATGLTAQPNAPWGLARIDSIKADTNNFVYSYDTLTAGVDVTVYVIDTGILASHVDFENRVKTGINFVGTTSGDDKTSDCDGHGTHVAGTIGGVTYGVAKQVNLVPVRVLDCNGSGSLSSVVLGIEWVIADYNSKNLVSSTTRMAGVVNMSLGSRASTSTLSLEKAVDKLSTNNIVAVVAAGNEKQDACKFSPAKVPSAMTVGATDKLDARASFSNFGKCLDIFAPGVKILSDYWTATNATAVLDGTSMAAPHVAGCVARYISRFKADPATLVADTIKKAALTSVSNAGTGTTAKLLYCDPAW